jgi:hypothetical protein
MMNDKAHDVFLRLQNIKSLIVDEARKLHAGMADGEDLGMLLEAEAQLRGEFEAVMRDDVARFE